MRKKERERITEAGRKIGGNERDGGREREGGREGGREIART